MVGKSASEILQEIVSQQRQVILDPDKYPMWVLTDNEQQMLTTEVVEALARYGHDMIQHVATYTVNYAHGVEGAMFFTEVGKSLLAFAPWIALRMFALGAWAATHGYDKGLFNREEEAEYWADLLKMYQPFELVEENDLTVMQVDNPFTGDNEEEQ